MPKRIIEIGQRETGRYNYNEQPEIDLFTSNITNCVAVVFTDKLGNVSLTHVDVRTDLTFLWREAVLMKGIFTVDIVKRDTADSSLADLVLKKLQSKYPTIKNSKGNQEHRVTKFETLLLRNGKLMTPTIDNINQISPLHANQKLQPDNPLKDDKLEYYNPVREVLAQYERVFNTNLDGKEYLPVVVFDREWTGQCSRLTPTAQRIVDAYKAKELFPADIIKIGRKCLVARTKHNVDFVENHLVPVLNRYLAACERLKSIEEMKKQGEQKRSAKMKALA